MNEEDIQASRQPVVIRDRPRGDTQQGLYTLELNECGMSIYLTHTYTDFTPDLNGKSGTVIINLTVWDEIKATVDELFRKSEEEAVQHNTAERLLDPEF